MKLQDLIAKASPLPWPTDWTECESPGGTTCSEANANSRLKRHAVNMLPKLLAALKAQRPEADYDSDEELEECIRLRREAIAECNEVEGI